MDLALYVGFLGRSATIVGHRVATAIYSEFWAAPPRPPWQCIAESWKLCIELRAFNYEQRRCRASPAPAGQG